MNYLIASVHLRWSMDGLQYLLSKVLPPFMSPIMPSERIYWLYLGSALIIAFVVYFATYAFKTLKQNGKMRVSE